MKHDAALKIAQEVVSLLRPACLKIEIAGSLRRGKAEVGDIDLVLLPESPKLLDNAILGLVVNNVLHFGKTQGDKQKTFLVPKSAAGAAGALKVELWIAQAANFGNTLLVRTGDAEFSKAAFSERKYGGLLRPGYYHEGGRLWRNGEPLDCYDEVDYFNHLLIDPVPPADRTAAILPELRAAQARRERHIEEEREFDHE